MEKIETTIVNNEIDLISNRSNGGRHLMEEALINQIIPSLNNAWVSDNSAKVIEKIKEIQTSYEEINAYAAKLKQRVQIYASKTETADTVSINDGSAE